MRASGAFPSSRWTFRVYVTDPPGRVLFDSENQAVGRTTRSGATWRARCAASTAPASTREVAGDDTSGVMHVAAPIYVHERIAGVLTVAKPTRTVQRFIDRAERKVLMGGLLLLAAVGRRGRGRDAVDGVERAPPARLRPERAGPGRRARHPARPAPGRAPGARRAGRPGPRHGPHARAAGRARLHRRLCARPHARAQKPRGRHPRRGRAAAGRAARRRPRGICHAGGAAKRAPAAADRPAAGAEQAGAAPARRGQRPRGAARLRQPPPWPTPGRAAQRGLALVLSGGATAGRGRPSW
jgi:two-component system sensor histidine kinase CreC